MFGVWCVVIAVLVFSAFLAFWWLVFGVPCVVRVCFGVRCALCVVRVCVVRCACVRCALCLVRCALCVVRCLLLVVCCLVTVVR